MQKKKFDLTSDIVDIQLDKAKDCEPNKTVQSIETVKKQNNVLLTISVTPDKRREFKTWCAENNLKMNEAFNKGFELLKATQEKINT